MATHHTTPLRRISHGSLSQSAQASTSSPTQLDFLAQPLADLVDEIDALHQNLININALSDSLGAFNEGFATFLYGMRMNAFSVEWPQAPSQLSFDLHDSTIIHPPPPPPPAPAADPSTSESYRTPSSPATTSHPADTTYATQYSYADDPPPPPKTAQATRGAARGRGIARGRGAARGGAAGGVAARKAREAKINAIVETLPLEFRGSDPGIRLSVEKVITALLAKPTGLKMVELTDPPALPHARVNKCLIALVSKKIVQKISEGGTTVYQLV